MVIYMRDATAVIDYVNLTCLEHVFITAVINHTQPSASRQNLSFGGRQPSSPPCRLYAKFKKKKI